MKTFNEINDTTGFANGAKFSSADEVRDYLTSENIIAMFNLSLLDGGVYSVNQDELDAMADTVIANKWHCDF